MLRISFLLVASLLTLFADGELVQPLNRMAGLSIRCDTEEKLTLVHSYLNNQDFNFSSISKHLENEIKVLVPATSLDEFKTVLTKYQIDYTLLTKNVSSVTRDDDAQGPSARRSSRSTENEPPAFFSDFPRYAKIEEYLKDLAVQYSNITSVEKIGSSYNGRAIWALKISSGAGDHKPAVLIDAGIHAREWIATTTALYAIHQLVVNKTNSKLYEDTDWYIIPNLNPDGYEFTHTGDPIWRKTKSPNSVRDCDGTDLNRNFDIQWMQLGASSDPCSVTYAGKEPFSESESRSLRDFVWANNKSIKAYISLHACGQYLIYPTVDTSKRPDSERELSSVAIAAEKALSSVRGKHYKVGTLGNVLYLADGGSFDWVVKVAGVPLGYVFELPCGSYWKFIPSPSEIDPIGFETFEAFKVIRDYVATHYGQQNSTRSKNDV